MDFWVNNLDESAMWRRWRNKLENDSEGKSINRMHFVPE